MKMRIGVLTYHRSHNYGACLQGYALASWIEENTGIKAELIDYNMNASEKFYFREIFRGKHLAKIISNIRRYCMFKESALKDFPLSSETLISDSISQFEALVSGKYDIIVVGSDEVWKLGFRGFPNPYFLPDIDVPHKLGYAVSVRCDFSALGSEKVLDLQRYLDSFEYIGVRDKATQESIIPYTTKSKVFLNCDPTFNYDFKPDILHGKSIIASDKKTIGFMFIDSAKARKIIEHYGDKYNYIALYDAVPGIRNLCSVSPFDWVDIVSACDFLITNYFHCMCFALKGNVPFIIMEIRGGKKEDSKSFDILSECGLADRFFMKEELADIDPICKIIDRDIGNNIDFSNVVMQQRGKSQSFLNALHGIIKQEEEVK